MEKINAMERLNQAILKKNCRIVAGLDPIFENMPSKYQRSIIARSVSINDILLDYSYTYIQAISPIVPAIKINSGFFDKYNASELYFQIATFAKEQGLFVISDTRRDNIATTTSAYAKEFLSEVSPFDAVTINPYLGTDKVKLFLDLAKRTNKGVFVLVRSSDLSLQDQKLKDGRMFSEAIVDFVKEWGNYTSGQKYERYNLVGAVVDATHPKETEILRKRMPNTFFLVSGYGAQGASASDVALNFDSNGLGAIVNSSRGIMNAYKNKHWKGKYSEQTWSQATTAEVQRATEEINQAISKRLFNF